MVKKWNNLISSAFCRSSQKEGENLLCCKLLFMSECCCSALAASVMFCTHVVFSVTNIGNGLWLVSSVVNYNKHILTCGKPCERLEGQTDMYHEMAPPVTFVLFFSHFELMFTPVIERVQSDWVFSVSKVLRIKQTIKSKGHKLCCM